MNDEDIREALIISQSEAVCRLKAAYSELDSYEFSKKHKKYMAKLTDKMRGDRYHVMSSAAAKILIAAAVLAALCVSALAFPSVREALILKFEKYSSYEIKQADDFTPVKSFELSYIPEGFELADSNCSYAGFDYYYRNDGADEIAENTKPDFTAGKYIITTYIRFDTEHGETETIEHNGIEYAVYHSDYNRCGVIWNDGVYIYAVSGSLPESEILKIAYSCG